MAVILGPVKPWTLAAYNEINAKYPLDTVYGVHGSTRFLDHMQGRALDMMTFDDRAKGDAIAAYAIANYQRLGIAYVIWQQRIWYPGRGWQGMADRGNPNLNHTNHVHISFNATAPKGGPTVSPVSTNSPLPGIVPGIPTLESFSGLIAAAKWASDSANWLRVGMFISGALLIMVGVMGLSKTTQTIRGATNAIAQS